MALFTLGDLAFEPGGVNLDGVTIRESWRHNYQDAIRGKGHRNFTGKQTGSLTFSGAVFPGLYGADDAVERVRELADTGESRELLDGNGAFLGRYVITSLEHERIAMLPDGTGRQVTYRLELREDPGV